MTTAPVRLARTVPGAVRVAVLAWLTAIGAGAAETAVRIGLPDPPTDVELGLRSGLYAALIALVLALRTGRNGVRWTLAVLLGGFGLASLLLEPVGWVLAGGSVPMLLVAAEGSTWTLLVLRALHVAAVLLALVAMFRPAADRFFRSPGVRPG